MHGRFRYGSKGACTVNGFPKCTYRLSPGFGSSKQKFCSYPPLLRSSLPLRILDLTGIMTEFVSTISYTEAETAGAPNLEPVFEHLLRNSMVHEKITQTLRINAITDRDSFVNMFDSETTLKQGAADLGTDLVAGGLSQKREFARVVTAWKTARLCPTPRCKPMLSRVLTESPLRFCWQTGPP